MQVTRRFWTAVAVGGFLAIWGVLVAEPLVVLGSAGVAGWLLARQYRFVRRASRTPFLLTVTLSTEQRITAEETSQLSLEATLDNPLGLTVDAAVTPPVGATGDPAGVSLAPNEKRGLTQTTLAWPVAGSFMIDDVTATVTDDAGLFSQRVAVDTEVAVTVNPRAPRDMHVGEGGDPITGGFGEHEASRLGSSIEPAEVREYVPGDSVRHIDWKATARLDRPHVKEFEGGTDRETLLVFDHRATMADGRPGTRKLDYARQLAVAVVDRAHEFGDQLGYYAVGDGGLTETVSPAARADTWAPVRRQLLGVAPTDPSPARGDPVSSASASVAAMRLRGDDSAFVRTLSSFFEAREPYRRQFRSRPLYRTVTSADYSSTAMVRTVIVTDDSNPSELREAVKYAHDKGSWVTVFLTPTVLFETADLTDLDRSYDDYVDFEEFRRELATLDRVDAYEVGPADRLSAVLSAGRNRRTRGNA